MGLIVYKGIEAEDSEERRNETGRFTTFPDLLMGTMEEYEEAVKYSALSASLSHCIGIIALLFDLDK